MISLLDSSKQVQSIFVNIFPYFKAIRILLDMFGSSENLSTNSTIVMYRPCFEGQQAIAEINYSEYPLPLYLSIDSVRFYSGLQFHPDLLSVHATIFGTIQVAYLLALSAWSFYDSTAQLSLSI